jgi:hypothetical protein
MRKRKPDRLIRFVLHTTENVDEKKLHDRVQLALGEVAIKRMPDLLRVDKSFWDHRAKSGRRPDSFNFKKRRVAQQRAPYFVDDATLNRRIELVNQGKSPDLPIKLVPFMPDPAKRSPKLAPGLGHHRFYILTIPYYEGTFRRKQPKPNGTLFDIGYYLRKKCPISSAVPDIEYPHYHALSSPFGSSKDCPPETHNKWHLENIHYDAVPAGIDGSGIRIGHPDTGWTRHDQLNFPPGGDSPNYDLNADVNVFDSNSASAEEAVPSTALMPHHGTATGSLLISKHDDKVNGIAPNATVVSIRAINSVILIGDVDVAQAIVAAVDAGAHVISMSLGGYPAPILEWTVNWAVANNVIVVAAAGNYWPFVVYPAAYPACIAVAGSTIGDTVWAGSARDQFRQGLVDISAPSECVHQAYWSDREPRSNPASGTSFGTAIVAGSAALWLQHFDRNKLIASLAGRATLQDLFRKHLRDTARRRPWWDVGLDGPGILDLRGLMDKNKMPDPQGFSSPIREAIGDFFGKVDPTAPPGSRYTPPKWVKAIFGDDAENMVDQFGDEIITAVMSNPVLASLAQAVEAAAEAVENAAEDAVNAVGDAVEEAGEALGVVVEEFIDTAVDTLSDTADKVAGWFGF